MLECSKQGLRTHTFSCKARQLVLHFRGRGFREYEEPKDDEQQRGGSDAAEAE